MNKQDSANMLPPGVVKNGLHDMDLERINLATDKGRSRAEGGPWTLAITPDI